jgi:hypothetical protein
MTKAAAIADNAAARGEKILFCDQRDLASPVPSEKIFRFPHPPNHF